MQIMITKAPNGGYVITDPQADMQDLMTGRGGIYAAVGNLEEAIEAVGNVLMMDPDSVHHSTMNLQMEWVDHAAPVHPYPAPREAGPVGDDAPYDPKAPLMLDESGFLGAAVYDDSVKQAEIAGLVPSERSFTTHNLEVAPHYPKKDLRPGDVDHDTEH